MATSYRPLERGTVNRWLREQGILGMSLLLLMTRLTDWFYLAKKKKPVRILQLTHCSWSMMPDRLGPYSSMDKQGLRGA